MHLVWHRAFRVRVVNLPRHHDEPTRMQDWSSECAGLHSEGFSKEYVYVGTFA